MDNPVFVELVDRVTQALEGDPRTRDMMIEVSNQRGIVTLSGIVKKEETRQAAEEIVRKLDGVITVINELKVV